MRNNRSDGQVRAQGAVGTKGTWCQAWSQFENRLATMQQKSPNYPHMILGMCTAWRCRLDPCTKNLSGCLSEGAVSEAVRKRRGAEGDDTRGAEGGAENDIMRGAARDDAMHCLP